jgi:DNA-binding Lrp family transcriptional regulator
MMMPFRQTFRKLLDISCALPYNMGVIGREEEKMKPRVDDMDRAILRALREDARMSCAEIARRVGFCSPRTIRSRLRRLRKAGVIRITAGARPDALGYPIKADIAVSVEPGKVKEVAEALVALDRVWYVATVTGDSDLSIQINAADLHDLQEFITRDLQSIPGVRSTRSWVLTDLLKEGCDWPIPKDIP